MIPDFASEWCWKLNFVVWQDGPAYVRVFVRVLRDIFKDDTVEYVLALIDEMLAGNLLSIGHFVSHPSFVCY